MLVAAYEVWQVSFTANGGSRSQPTGSNEDSVRQHIFFGDDV